jgi:hypothetical protein
MKEELGLVLESAHLPFHVINMLELGGMVPNSCFLRHDVLLGIPRSQYYFLLGYQATGHVASHADEVIA